MKMFVHFVSALVLLSVSGSAMAQAVENMPSETLAGAVADDDAKELGEIVVTARRIGLPMWTVRRGDEGVLILVGNIREVPEDFRWRQDALESAVAQVDRVLYPQEGRASPLDIMRILWRVRTIIYLPNQGSLDQVVPDEDYRRLEALMADGKNNRWRSMRPLIVAMDLAQNKAGDNDSKDPDLEKVAGRAARRARVQTHHIGVVRGSEVVDSLITSSPESQLPCLRAAIDAAAYGSSAMADRAEAWRRQDVRAVMANPFDRVTDECWPWGDPRVRGRMRTEWFNAISTAISDQGVTLAIAPVRTLGEQGGVLDMLEAQGFEIDGPEWRDDRE